MVATRAAKKRRTSKAFDDMMDAGILCTIMSFVGPNQYRFVAAVHPNFKKAYETSFSFSKITFPTAHTPAHAKICYQEMDKKNEETHAGLIRNAGKHGNIESIEYLRSVPCGRYADSYRIKLLPTIVLDLKRQRDFAIVVTAAIYGHIHVLDWAQKNVIDIWGHYKICTLAAECGHISVLQWFHNHSDDDCWRGLETCIFAARAGRLDVLKWLQNKGYPLSRHVWNIARQNGHTHLYEWLQENQCPTNSDDN